MAQRNRSPPEEVYVGKDPEVDIIAVHGMAADVDSTWAWRDQEQQPKRSVNWLRDPDMLSHRIPRSRILLYHYDSTWFSDAPKTHLQQCGEALIRDVHVYREQDTVTRPIVFIGHSLGGNVIQNALLYPNTDEEEQSVVASTIGLIFLGSPLCGVRTTTLPKIAARIMQLAGSHDEIIKELEFLSSGLLDKRDRLCKVLGKHSISCFCFYEIYLTDYAKKAKGVSRMIPKVLFVEPSSACIPGHGKAQLRADHFQMNKFRGPSDASFTSVTRETCKMCDKVLNTQQRFQEPLPRDFDVERTHSNSFQTKPPHFVERPGLIRRIEEEMHHTAVNRSILYLHGMTASGKTLLARHFGRSHEFTARFDLPGTSEAELRASLAKYAEDIPGLLPTLPPLHDSSVPMDAKALQAREDDNVERILSWLNESGNDAWYILIDNVHCHEHGESARNDVETPGLGTLERVSNHWVTRYTDALKQGSIIVTSQSSRLSNMYPSIKISGLQENESLRLFETILGQHIDTASNSYLDLARVLDNHALSVDDAAQYMNRYKNVGPKRYLELWRSNSVDTRDDPHLNQRTTQAVDWAVKSLDPAVQKFLQICAFMDPACIWPGLFPELENLFSHFVEKLSRIALADAPRRDGPQGGFSIHPAIHRVIRTQVLSTIEAEKAIYNAMVHVAEASLGEYEDDLADQQRHLLPHIEQCLESLLFLKEADVDLGPEILPCLRHLGLALQQRGQFEGAKIFYTSVLAAYDALAAAESIPDGPQSENQPSNSSLRMEPDYYVVVNSYGQILKMEGHRDKAEQCFVMVRQSLDSSTDRPYPESRNDAEPLINLALCLRQRGRLEEAEWYLRSAETTLEGCDDTGSRIQKHQISQYFGSIFKMRNELVEAGCCVDEAVSKLENELKRDSVEVALAQKELGAIRLLQATEESLSLAGYAFEAA